MAGCLLRHILTIPRSETERYIKLLLWRAATYSAYIYAADGATTRRDDDV